MATMMGEPTTLRVAQDPVPDIAPGTRLWPRLGFVLVLALSAALEFAALDREGYANTYYAAGVKSMLTSWHNLFFASFGCGGLRQH